METINEYKVLVRIFPLERTFLSRDRMWQKVHWMEVHDVKIWTGFNLSILCFVDMAMNILVTASTYKFRYCKFVSRV